MVRFTTLSKPFDVFLEQQENFEKACDEHDKLIAREQEQLEYERANGIKVHFDTLGSYMNQAIDFICNDLGIRQL